MVAVRLARTATIFLLMSAVASAGPLDRAYNLSMRAHDLLAAFQENEVAADAKYGNQRVSLGGIVQRVGKDQDGDPYVMLGSSEHGGAIRCKFSEAFTAQVARLQKGSGVAIRGTVVGRSSSVILKDCSL
jgi:hypothetical protein